MAAVLKWNKEQIFAICDEFRKIQQIPNGSLSGPPSTRTSDRGDALRELCKKLGVSERAVRSMYRGEVDYSRPWVVEWRQANGILPSVNGDTRVVRKPNARISDDVVALVQRLRADGHSYSAITRKTGIPEGSLSNIIHRRTTNGVPPPPPVTPKKRPASVSQPPKVRARKDLGADFQAFIDAKEEEAMLELRSRHSAEQTEMNRRHEAEEKALQKDIADRRAHVIEQLVDLWTKQGTQEK